MSLFSYVLISVTVIIGIFLIIFILMQRSRQDGLGSAFGGAMTESIFGAQTSNILSKITQWLIGIFFILCIAISYISSNWSESKLEQRLKEQDPVTVAAAIAKQKKEQKAASANIPSFDPKSALDVLPDVPQESGASLSSESGSLVSASVSDSKKSATFSSSHSLSAKKASAPSGGK